MTILNFFGGLCARWNSYRYHVLGWETRREMQTRFDVTMDVIHEGYRGNIQHLRAQLDGLQAPADTVPFCVDCHGPIKRGMPYHVLTIRHGDCRFVPSSVVTQSTNEGDNLTLAAAGSVPKADPGFSDAAPAVEEGAEVKP